MSYALELAYHEGPDSFECALTGVEMFCMVMGRFYPEEPWD